jgi:hypothetical protein
MKISELAYARNLESGAASCVAKWGNGGYRAVVKDAGTRGLREQHAGNFGIRQQVPLLMVGCKWAHSNNAV